MATADDDPLPGADPRPRPIRPEASRDEAGGRPLGRAPARPGGAGRPRRAISNALGGGVGWLAAGYLADRGFYAMIFPGGFLGIGCALLARHRSTARGIACGVAALMLGLLCEWDNFPFVADPSLPFFASHLHWLPPWRWAFHGVGAALAFWCGRDPFGGMARGPGETSP